MQDENKITGQLLTADQAADISGGVDASSCPTNITVGPYTGPADVGAVLTGIYEGFVEVTSRVIERVVQATK
jgi:hypothetical protein